jgi:regulator of RNase E activity RraA
LVEEGIDHLSASAVSDALDRLGIPGAMLGLGPLGPSQRIWGSAYTVRYVPTGRHGGTVGDYIDDVPAGGVVVLANDGRTDCTVWGDILTAVAAERGIAGTVVDGVCRDVKRALNIGYPIYSRGRFMRTGKDRVEVADTECTVSIGGVQVRNGDLIVGDDDGVVVVPAGYELEVLAAAAAIAKQESAILDDALSAGSLREARQRHGYHELQRRQESNA